MKKLTVSVLVVALSSSFVLVDAQRRTSDSVKTKDIEGVVVTALGIKREKKSLGYSSQEVKSEQLFGGTTNTGNIATELSGKVAGLNVNANSNFGGATNLVIRGVKTLGGSNPLIVIDGSPVNNTQTTSGDANGGYDLGNALSDISQDDIESINVLKGAAASALYGERGLNGVIVITTKNGHGRDDGSWGVTLTSSVQAGFIDKSTFPKYQTQYGEGYYGGSGSYWDFRAAANGTHYSNLSDDASWGPAFNPNLMVYQWNSLDPTSPTYGQATPWVAAKHGPLAFFQTPTSFINSISLSKGHGGDNINLSFDNNISNGLLPNSDLNKNTFSLKVNYDFTPKLHASLYSTLTLQNTVGRNENGYSGNIVSGFRQWWPVNVDLYDVRDAYYRNIAAPTSANNYGNFSWNMTSPRNPTPLFWNNPYFQRYQSYESDKRTRSFSYANLTYDIDNHLSVIGKVSYDNTAILYEQRLASGSVPSGFGVSGKNAPSGYDRTNINRREINYDLIGNYKYNITSDIDISGIVGGTIRRSDYSSIESSTEGGLIIPGLYAVSNSVNPVLAPLETQWTTQTNSIYATTSLDFYKIFYLDGTIRRDVSSTLPNGNNKYTYPSISGSLILTELFKPSWMNYWKIRGNYAEVGGTADPYQLSYSYKSNGVFSTHGIGIYYPPTTLPNANLLPQRSKEYEVGTEIHFLHDRITLDAAYYKTKTMNQLITPNISAGSGQIYAAINAGEIDNKGAEISLGLVPIKTQNFLWRMDANWATNKSLVVALTSGITSYPLVGMVGATVTADVGKPWGDIYGTDYVYLNGKKVIDPTSGLYETNNNQVIGNVLPKWTGGIRNSFTYKSLSLSFLIDVRKGGDIFSSDMYYGLSSGMYAETAVPGYRTVQAVLPGVNPNGQVNTTPVDASGYPAAGYANNPNDSYALAPAKRFVYDGSFVKLREASITYAIPKSLLNGTFLNAASVSLVGRNLWIIHKNLPYADPESTQMGGLYSYGSSIGSLPSTRDIGINFTFKF